MPLDASLAQVIALATYGNAYLHAAGDAPPPDLAATNPTFHSVDQVQFTSLASGAGCRQSSGMSGIGTVAHWYSSIQSRGAVRLWPIARRAWSGESHENAHGSAGGWRGGLVVEYPWGYETWVAAPSLARQEADKRQTLRRWNIA